MVTFKVVVEKFWEAKTAGFLFKFAASGKIKKVN